LETPLTIAATIEGCFDFFAGALERACGRLCGRGRAFELVGEAIPLRILVSHQ